MLSIRQAVEADLPAICRLGDQVNQLHHQAWPSVFLPQGEPLRDADLWRTAFQRSDARCLVAVQHGEAVGFITAFLDAAHTSVEVPQQFVRIGTVVVDAACRGRGVGKQLMAEIEDWAREQGAGSVRLHAWLFNRSAIELYEALGYQARWQSMSKPL